MKKVTLLIVFFLSIATLIAQVPRDKVVVEVGTGTWCPYCPGAAMGVDDLISNGWAVAAIENHNGDVFANQYSNARNSYYNITGYPTAFFDGVLSYVGGSSSQSMYNNYYPRVQQRLNIPSPVTISVYGTATNLTYNIVVTVTKVSNISGSDIRLHVALTESNIIYYWQGQSHLNYVNRLMVPDQNGTVLNFSNSDVLEIPLTFTRDGSWNVMNMELAAFVQTNSNKEIHQGFKVYLPFMSPPPPPLVSEFACNDTINCETNQVNFVDESSGNPNAWLWEFPGGTPETSTEKDPVITYNTEGKFDVTLTVTRGTNSSTLVKTDYISVFEPPAVSFEAIEDQCINYPSFELMQGYPAGGTYSGPGVEDGFFHPIIAGMGTHTLLYTYMDEHECENSAEQTVVVDACTGVPESAGVRITALPNPTTGSLKLSLYNMNETSTVRIMNAMGKTIFQKENIAPDGDFNTSIDLSGQANGIYYIQVEGGKNTYFKKVILQK